MRKKARRNASSAAAGSKRAPDAADPNSAAAREWERRRRDGRRSRAAAARGGGRAAPARGPNRAYRRGLGRLAGLAQRRRSPGPGGGRARGTVARLHQELPGSDRSRPAVDGLPPDTRFAIRGSAVTGNGFEGPTGAYTKDYFDVGRTTDHDTAIVSRTPFEKARKIGVELRQGGTRTDVLRDNDLAKLGLSSLLDRIHKLTGRDDTRLMIYRSIDALNKRGENIPFDPK